MGIVEERGRRGGESQTVQDRKESKARSRLGAVLGRVRAQGEGKAGVHDAGRWEKTAGTDGVWMLERGQKYERTWNVIQNQ